MKAIKLRMSKFRTRQTHVISQKAYCSCQCVLSKSLRDLSAELMEKVKLRYLR